MIIIDTNVISELLRPTPEPAVEAWLGEQDGLSIYLTAISEAELRYGVAIMTSGKRRDGLGSAIARILRDTLQPINHSVLYAGCHNDDRDDTEPVWSPEP